ncbi:unnamed protein product, partial [Owenia fusiformis]
KDVHQESSSDLLTTIVFEFGTSSPGQGTPPSNAKLRQIIANQNAILKLMEEEKAHRMKKEEDAHKKFERNPHIAALVPVCIRSCTTLLNLDPWNFDAKFIAPENMQLNRKVTEEILKHNDKWSITVVEAHLKRYFNIKRTYSRRANRPGASLKHKEQITRRNRLTRKLKSRKDALGMLESEWSETKIARVGAILTEEYISSDEEDINEEDSSLKPNCRPKLVKKLTWESDRLCKVKQALDEKYRSKLSKASKKNFAKSTRGKATSIREAPENAPSWTLKL